jgi:uncharacterized protein (UPF0276 family)
MSYIKTVSTKELAENKTTQIHRIHSLTERLKNKNFTEYFPNEKMVKEALAFEKKELKAIDEELDIRLEVEVMTIKVDKENFGVGFYVNVNFWEDWFYHYLEEDFGISPNRTLDLHDFQDILERHGYKFYDKHIYSNITDGKLIQDLFHFNQI